MAHKPWYYMSAYAIAVKHGFEGTEEEWLEYIKGATGAQGIQGETGDSAYQIAVKYGYAGTEAQWNAELAQAKEDAKASAYRAQTAADLAETYVEHIGDPIAGIVTPWLDDHLTNPTNPPLDTSLLVENAAADAKATGDAIRAAHVAVDELGSTFDSQNELYLYHQSIKDCPEYTFHFADSSYTPGGYSGADAPVYNAEAETFTTRTCPVDVDDSMMLHIAPGVGDPTGNNKAYYVAVFGHMESGNFVPNFYVYGCNDTATCISIRQYKDRYALIENPKLVLQAYPDALGGLSRIKGMKLTRSNPYCTDSEFLQRSMLLTSNYDGRFVNMLEAQSGGYATTLKGRYITYWTTRLTLLKEEWAIPANATAPYTLVPTKLAENDMTFMQERYVRGKAEGEGYDDIAVNATTSYAIVRAEPQTASDPPKGSIILKRLSRTASSPRMVSVTMAYHAIKPNDRDNRLGRKPYQKYMYAYGLPIDAMFWDANGNQIAWYDDYSGTLRGSVKECLAPPAAVDVDYPTCIKIPDNAESYHFAVYGLVMQGKASTTSRTQLYLSSVLAEYAQKIGMWGHADHAPVMGRYAGSAVRNAKKLTGWRYPSDGIVMRMHVPNATLETSVYTNDNYDNTAAEAEGIVYTENTQRSVGTHISWYTYLTLFRHLHGVNSIDHMPPPGANAVAGLMCAGYMAAVFGLKHTQSVEYFIQKYADKLVRLTKNTPMDFKPGDIILSSIYRKPIGGSENLRTHIQMVTDEFYNAKTGEFYWYEMADCAERWTRLFLSNGNDRVTNMAERDPAVYDVYEGYSWKLSDPVAVLPELTGDTYKFAIDKSLDPLNNPDVGVPPIVSALGDMCIVGGYPVINGQEQTYYHSESVVRPGYEFKRIGYTFYIKKDVPGIRISRKGPEDDDYTEPRTVATGTTTESKAYRYYTQDLSDYMTTSDGQPQPGEYLIEPCADAGGGSYVPISSMKPTHVFIPRFPEEVTISSDGKTVEISDMYKTSAEGKVKCLDFDEIWVRVKPQPATVDVGNGVSKELPWANYMYVPAEELFMAVSADSPSGSFPGVLSVGTKYIRILAVTLINSKYGGVSYRFEDDYDSDEGAPEDETVPADDDPVAELQPEE